MVIVNVIIAFFIICLIVCIFLMHYMLVRMAVLIEDQKTALESSRKLDNTWIFNLQNGRLVKEFFLANRFRKIAILGYGSYSHLLFEELSLADEGFEAVCVDDEHTVGLSPIPGLDFIGFAEFLDNIGKYDIIVDVAAYGDGIEPSEMRKAIPEDSGCKIVKIVDLIYYITEL